MLPPSFMHVHELEGIVSKLATTRYRSGRSKTWLKTKCFTESEFLLLGIDRDRKTCGRRRRNGGAGQPSHCQQFD